MPIVQPGPDKEIIHLAKEKYMAGGAVFLLEQERATKEYTST